MKPIIIPAEEVDIDEEVEWLRNGNLLAIPTETVYGLAANASDEVALKKIFRLKGRPENHPLIVHIAAPHYSIAKQTHWEIELSKWSRDVPPEAIRIADQFWPGPLTMILKKSRHVLDLVTGGQDTVGIRAPSHPFTIELLQAFGGGLAAPSANRFGKISPTIALDVFEEFEGFVDEDALRIIDGGICHVGIESTILDLSRMDELGPVILRPGMVSSQAIDRCLGSQVKEEIESTIRHSGGMLGHYAPNTSLEIRSVDLLNELDFQQGKIAIASFSSVEFLKSKWPDKEVFWYQLSDDPHQVAKDLYRILRQFDKANYRKIIFDQVPSSDAWGGIRDRITRSAHGSGTINP